jgi:hypothetical protein
VNVPSLLLGGLMLTASFALALPPTATLLPPPAPIEAFSWSAQVSSLAAAGHPGLRPVAFHEDRAVPELVASIYAQLDLPEPTSPRMAQMAASARALDAGVAVALQQLLGAVDLGIQDWRASNTDQATMRLLATVDAASPLLLAAGKAPPATEATLFPGPNQGLLFNDPFNLILVGGPGASIYYGNNEPYGDFAPEANLLTLDLGGDDIYSDHPGSAYPLPAIVCGPCNKGVPISLTLDVTGDDRYVPAWGHWDNIALGYGLFHGVGILIDTGGDDRYVTSTGTGAGNFAGQGFLLDASGDDIYQTQSGSQGYAIDEDSMGILMDLSGSDTYSAGFGTRGYTLASGTFAAFFDGCGADSYLSYPGTNGDMWQQTSMGYGVDQAIDC